MAARLFNGLLKPKKLNILGFEVAGIVEAIGQYITRFEVGDEVYLRHKSSKTSNCGEGYFNLDAYTTYAG